MAQNALAQSAIDLNALPYAASAVSRGQTGEERRVFMRSLGERAQWFQSFDSSAPAPDGTPPNGAGNIFVPAPLSSDVRVLFFQAETTNQAAPFGEIAAGQTLLSFMPDEIAPSPGDRFVRLDALRTDEETIRSINAPLSRKRIVSIEAITQDGQRLAPSLYALTNGALAWTGTPPTGSVSVIYSYTPVYEWLGQNYKTGPLGTDGVRLPSTGPLRLIEQGEE